LIVTGSWDRTAKIWNVETGTCTATLQGHARSVSSAVFSPNGQLIVTSSDDGTAKVWINNFTAAGLTPQQALTLSIQDVLHIYKTGEKPTYK
jgi:WD40 repeat protein